MVGHRPIQWDDGLMRMNTHLASGGAEPTMEAQVQQAGIAAAASRPLGPGRTVWLASYPKSGNTWMRAIVTALSTHKHLFGVNQLGSGAQPNYVGATLPVWGIDPRWLNRDEIDVVRDALVRRWGGVGQADPDARGQGEVPADEPAAAAAEPLGTTAAEAGAPEPPAAGADALPQPPFLRKTHEVYRPGEPGREPFPIEATRAAILIVRDPRDVACSYAPFFGLELDAAVDAIGRESGAEAKASPAQAQTAQPWGSWSSHAQSWLAESVPFPVHLVRYEDLKADAAATLVPVFAAIGLECTDEQLQAALEQTRFERLKNSETERGFRETSPKTREFFRKGKAGGWREELTDSQVSAIEADHAETMAALGYALTTDAATREPLWEVRESRRRQERSHWLHLPDVLGIEVRAGEVPEELPGAKRPRKWIQVADDEILVRFSGGAGLLARGGKEVIVQWPEEALESNDDPSWIVQGWGVTLAMLQRGDLSLHAATLRIGEEIVAIAGNRGAGKSTTSMALRQRGHQLLIDDVTLIEFRDGEAWTTPFSRNVHLLPDAAAAVGLDFDAMRLLAGGRTKVGFRAEDPPETPHRIDRIVVLAPSVDATEVTVTEQRGADRLSALVAHTRRDGIAPLVLGQDRYFALLAQLAGAVPVHVVSRPKEQWTLERVLEEIEALCGVRR